MLKSELVNHIKSLKMLEEGPIEGVFYDRYGGVITTDSIRVDMDGGRIILVQKGSETYETNKKNWQQEIKFHAKT